MEKNLYWSGLSTPVNWYQDLPTSAISPAKTLPRRQCTFSNTIYPNRGLQPAGAAPDRATNFHWWALNSPPHKSLLMVNNKDPTNCRQHVPTKVLQTVDSVVILAACGPYSAWGFLVEVAHSTRSREFLEETFFVMIHQTTTLCKTISILTKASRSRIVPGFGQQETSLTDSENTWVGKPAVPSESFHHWAIRCSWVGQFSCSKKLIPNAEQRCFWNLKLLWDGKTVRHLWVLSSTPFFFFLFLQKYFSEASLLLF